MSPSLSEGVDMTPFGEVTSVRCPMAGNGGLWRQRRGSIPGVEVWAGRLSGACLHLELRGG